MARYRVKGFSVGLGLRFFSIIAKTDGFIWTNVVNDGHFFLHEAGLVHFTAPAIAISL